MSKIKQRASDYRVGGTVCPDCPTEIKPPLARQKMYRHLLDHGWSHLDAEKEARKILIPKHANYCVACGKTACIGAEFCPQCGHDAQTCQCPNKTELLGGKTRADHLGTLNEDHSTPGREIVDLKTAGPLAPYPMCPSCEAVGGTEHKPNCDEVRYQNDTHDFFDQPIKEFTPEEIKALKNPRTAGRLCNCSRSVRPHHHCKKHDLMIFTESAKCPKCDAEAQSKFSASHCICPISGEVIIRECPIHGEQRATIASSKPKCPHCGSTEYSLMPSDFETAKCDKCGKNWDHGIVEGINDPSEKTAGPLQKALLPAALLGLGVVAPDEVGKATTSPATPQMMEQREKDLAEKREQAQLDRLVEAIRRAEGAKPELNNPGNIVDFNTGKIRKFDTYEEGEVALIDQLLRIKDGDHPYIKPEMSLEKAGLIYSNGDPNWAHNVSRIMHVPKRIPMGNLITGDIPKVGPNKKGNWVKLPAKTAGPLGNDVFPDGPNDFFENVRDPHSERNKQQRRIDEEYTTVDAPQIPVGASAGSARMVKLLERKYPKSVAAAQEKDSDEYGWWGDVVKSSNPTRELEKVVVYETLTKFGPDVQYETLGRHMPKIRRACKGDILAAFEHNKLEGVLDDMGYFGPKSDQMRPGDEYYASAKKAVRPGGPRRSRPEPKKYPDTLEGAKAYLKDECTIDFTGGTGRPDPQVQGVWEVWSKNGDRAIVYLAGYKEPVGGIRPTNDFEVETKEDREWEKQQRALRPDPYGTRTSCWRRMPSKKARLVYKTAGGVEFYTVGTGSTVEKAYENARNEARGDYRADHDGEEPQGYSGTILEKHGYRLLNPPKGVKPGHWAQLIMDAMTGDEINAEPLTYQKKVPYKEGQKCPTTNIYQGAEKPAIKKCNGTISLTPRPDRPWDQGPHCSAGHNVSYTGERNKDGKTFTYYYTKTEKIKDEALANEARRQARTVQDKFGPAGAVQVAANKWAFFGIASS